VAPLVAKNQPPPKPESRAAPKEPVAKDKVVKNTALVLAARAVPASGTRPTEPVTLEPVAAANEAVRTVQLPAQIVPDRGPALRPPPEPAAKPSVSAAAAAKPAFPLAGRWLLQPGGYSRSPSLPQELAVSVTDNGGGIQGTLEGKYKSKSKTEHVGFSFAGRTEKGAARFPWVGKDGRRGQIEFIPVPNKPDMVEVVWYGPDANAVFDEMLRRAK
jgi:hypothetical protein